MKHPVVLMLLVLSGLAPALMPGCASPPGIADIGPNVTVLRAVRPLDTVPPPAWTVDPRGYESAAANTEPLLGVSFPRQTLAFATLEADRDARVQAAKYVGETVAAKLAEAGRLDAAARFSPDTVVDEIIRSAVPEAPVGRLAETYVERVSAVDRGRPIVAYRVYRLRVVARSALAALGKVAAKPLAQEMQTEQDALRREQLGRLKEALETLSVKDFEP